MASPCIMARSALKIRSILISVTVLAVLLVFLKLGLKLYELLAVKYAKKIYNTRLSRINQRKKKILRASGGPFGEMSTDRLKQYVDVWHNGVADAYTSYGSLIVGVPPDAQKAKLAYEELVRRGDSSVNLAYAKLLEFGVPNDSSVIDKRGALVLYQKHYESMTDLYDRYDSLEAVERLSPPSAMFQVTALRSNLAGRMAALARENRRRACLAVETQRRGENPLMAGPPNLRNRLGMNPDEVWVQELPFDAFRPHDGGGVPLVGDRQNVHDSTVTRTVTASVERLRNENDGTLDAASSISDIRDTIRRADISPDKRANANLALDSIERNNQLNNSSGITETELLRLVWNRVHHGDNAANQKALKENLVDELSACVEMGTTVCSTGRFTHILGALNGVDEVVDIKPGWALSKELVERAAVMYRDKINALAAEDRMAVEAVDPTKEQAAKNDEIMDLVRSDLREDFKHSYVDAGIMTQEGLDVELNKWIDHIG